MSNEVQERETSEVIISDPVFFVFDLELSNFWMVLIMEFALMQV